MSNIVNYFLSEFSIHNKGGDEVYAVNREGDLYEFIRDEIHEDYQPDDFRFKTVYRALEDLSLQDQADLNVPILETDIYYADLNKWATRSISLNYLNDAIEQQEHFGIAQNYYQLIGRAQQMELDEISCKVYQFVQFEIEKFQAQMDAEDDIESEWEA